MNVWCRLSCKNGRAVKRESGVNPGQARCCEFRIKLSCMYEGSTVILFIYSNGKDVGERNESEDLPSMCVAICYTFGVFLPLGSERKTMRKLSEP